VHGLDFCIGVALAEPGAQQEAEEMMDVWISGALIV